MPAKYDAAIATEIINRFDARPEMLVQILRALVDRYGFISEEALRQVADELNLSRAEVHGVVSFYHDFRTRAPGRRIIKVCQAEACQAMGSVALTAHIVKRFGTAIAGTSEDGEVTIEPVYCLGNCACSPAVMIDDKVYGRVSGERFDRIYDASGE